MQTAAQICDEIAARREKFVDFSSIDSMSSKWGIKKKHMGVSVDEYRASKRYPSGPKDTRPPSIDFNKFAAHGTNLTSVISALIHTNQQLVPAIKARKLGIKFNTGENRDISFSEMNRKFVSTVAMHTSTSDIDSVELYSQNSAKLSSSGGHLQRKDLRSDTIPVIVFGDGIGIEPVRSDIRNEVGCKRVNIRMLALDSSNIKIANEIINYLRIENVKVIALDKIDTSEYSRDFGIDSSEYIRDLNEKPKMDPKKYWENLWKQA